MDQNITFIRIILFTIGGVNKKGISGSFSLFPLRVVSGMLIFDRSTNINYAEALLSVRHAPSRVQEGFEVPESIIQQKKIVKIRPTSFIGMPLRFP